MQKSPCAAPVAKTDLVELTISCAAPIDVSALVGEISMMLPVPCDVALVLTEATPDLSGEIIDGLAASNVFRSLHAIIEVQLCAAPAPIGLHQHFSDAFVVHDALQSHGCLASAAVGFSVSPDSVPLVAEVYEYCCRRNVHARFRLAADVMQYDQAARYQLVEFFEGLLGFSAISAAEARGYSALIERLLNKGVDSIPPVGTINIVSLRWQDGELQDSVKAKEPASCSHVPFTSWAEWLRFQSMAACVKSEQRDQSVIFRVRSLVLAGSRQLGLESALRSVARRCLLPYRRARSREQFQIRLARAKAASDSSAAWQDLSGAPRILICGWYGTETLGDKAILAGIVQSLNAVFEKTQVALVSLHPYVSEMTRSQMPELAEMRIVNPAQGVHLAGSADLVAFGGGPLMALGVLAEMQAIFEAARENGAATLVAGCGVGPLGEDWHNQSIHRILELSDVRIYRDSRSRDLAAGLGLDTSPDAVAEDPAFSWLMSSASRKSVRFRLDEPVLLLGLRDFPYKAYARHLTEAACQAARQRYESAVVDALETLVADNSELVIRPLPMCTNHFGGDDRWFYRRLFRGHSAILDRLDDSLLGIELPPVAYCQAFREARVGLVMRFHSLVFALGLDLPAVAIDYTLGRGKVNALAERFGVPQRSLDQLNADFLVTELQALLDAPLSQRADWHPVFNSVMCSKVPSLLGSQP